MRIVCLVSCSKQKAAGSTAAEHLYTSPRFRFARAYARGKFDAWYILSAKHFLVEPSKVLDPYDLSLNDMALADRKVWARQVADELVIRESPPKHLTILAGESYRVPLVGFLNNLGYIIDVPLAHMDQGTQLKWLKEQAREYS
ncbi:MAG: DUF6884 domain-containing protein [Alphaproteobacteria bacterium]